MTRRNLFATFLTAIVGFKNKNPVYKIKTVLTPPFIYTGPPPDVLTKEKLRSALYVSWEPGPNCIIVHPVHEKIAKNMYVG